MGKSVELQTRGRSPLRQDPCRRAHTSGGERHCQRKLEEFPHSPCNEFDIKDSKFPITPKNTLFPTDAEFVKTGYISQKQEHTALHDIRTSPMMRRSKTWAPDVSKSMTQRTDYDSPFTRSRSSTSQMIYTPERIFAKRNKVAATSLSRLQQLALPKFPGLANVCSLRRPRSMMELRDLDLEDYEIIREAEKTANKWHWAIKYWVSTLNNSAPKLRGIVSSILNDVTRSTLQTLERNYPREIISNSAISTVPPDDLTPPGA